MSNENDVNVMQEILESNKKLIEIIEINEKLVEINKGWMKIANDLLRMLEAMKKNEVGK